MITATRSPLSARLDGLPVDVDTDPDGADGFGEAAFGRETVPGAGDTRVYRYALTRTWEPGIDVLPWVMLNPSTANAFIGDPTIGRVISFSRGWGYGGAAALNLSALRSTDPRALRTHPAPIGTLNAEVITRVLRALGEAPRDVVCAWGANATPGQGEQMVRVIRDLGHRPVCLGLTRRGYPRHPLYVRGATPLRECP